MSNGSSVFDWAELIVLADGLNRSRDIGPEEAVNRSIINRAYFGAFCLARNVARERKWLSLSNNAGDHSKVQNYYKNSKDKTKKQIGLVLERLHIARKEADYKDILEGSFEKALKSIRQAQDIEAQLKSLS